MRAVRFHDWGVAPVVEEVPEPVRGAGEVLVRVRAAAVAHLDLTVSGGEFGMKPPLPYIGGVEGAGEVLAADPDTGLTEGTQILLRGGGLGLLRDGTWTERVSVPRKAITPLDAELPADLAASFFVPSTTAYVAVHDVARVEPGERVIVTGAAGAVGSIAAQLALAAGAEVLGVVSRPDSLAALPPTLTGVALTDTAAMAQLAKDRSAAALIDTIGGPDLITRTHWVRPGGRAVAIGYTAGPTVRLDLPSWLLDDVALLPVNMIRQEKRAREVAGPLAHKLASGELRLGVERFTLADTPLALDALRAGQIRGRAVVLPEGQV